MSLHEKLGLVQPPEGPEIEDRRPVLHPAALHGLAGEVVGMFEPNTEADPAGILATFLAAFGNAVGAGPYVVADGARHAARIFPVLVGNTSRGRKGTAQANVNWLMSHADPGWFAERMVSGLASGEGLIAALEPDDDGRPKDPRLFVVEPEFARVLKAAQREGSILSAVLRDAWDRGDLSNMTRHSPLRVKGAHISVVGHITVEELHRQLTETEAANGYANRHLFFWVSRSKRLPNGGGLDDSDVAALGVRVGKALSGARKVGRLRRSEAANRMWEQAYYAVDDNVPGMLGAILARTEAQLLRLSMLYALLDGSATIEAPHLYAAAAVWDYSALSAGMIFGAKSGDPVADQLLEAIKQAGPDGLSATAQRDLFGRHVTAARREAALDYLTDRGLIETVTVETGGRPRTVTRAATKATEATEVPGVIGRRPLLSLLSLSSHPKGGS